MDEFTIWCTVEQTKLALELGASINYGNDFYHKDYGTLAIPTAEQMIGWLEKKQGIQIAIIPDLYNRWQGLLYDIKKPMSEGQHIHQCNYVSTRPEATIAAINVALEYLVDKRRQ